MEFLSEFQDWEDGREGAEGQRGRTLRDPASGAWLRNPPIRSRDSHGALEVLIQSCWVAAHHVPVNDSGVIPRTPTAASHSCCI